MNTHNLDSRIKLEELVIREIGFDDPFCLESLLFIFGKMSDNPEEFSAEIKEYEAKTKNKHPLSFPLAKNLMEMIIDKETGFDNAKANAIYHYAIWYIKQYAEGFDLKNNFTNNTF
jgi:hypothetical protein